MINEEIEKLKIENVRLKSDLASLKEIQSDLWSHDIYRKASKKIIMGLSTIAILITGFGSYKIYELFKAMEVKIHNYMEEKVINDKIDQIIDIDVGKLVDGAEKDIKLRLKDLENSAADELEKLQAMVKKAEAESERLQDFLVAGRAQEPKVLDGLAQSNDLTKTENKKNCSSLELTDNQVALVSYDQISIDLLKKNKNGKNLYKNDFSIKTKINDKNLQAKELESCILNGIDRVVYELNERWFSPSKFVKVSKDDNFKFSITSWGVTDVKITLYFKGERSPSVFNARFVINDKDIFR